MFKWICHIGIMIILTSCSEPASPPAENTGAQGYIQLQDPLPGYADNNSANEVIEFFSYGCDHCARFNPQLENWKRAHPQIQIRKIPVLFSRPQFETLARLYFSLQDLGHGELDDAVFEAIHIQNKDLSMPGPRMAWARENRISPELLESKMSSPEISAKVNQADELAVKARIDGVPTLVVSGKYSVSLDQATSFDNMLSVTDALLAKQ